MITSLNNLSFCGLKPKQINQQPQKQQSLSPLKNDLSQDTISFSGEIKIVTGDKDSQLSKNIASQLQTNLTTPVVKKFHDGDNAETYVKHPENLRGKDVFLIEKTGGNPNDDIMEMLFLANAARQDGANKIIAVMPHYYYARQDRRSTTGEDESAKTVANLMQACGINETVIVEPHFDQIDSLFDIPVTKISTMKILADQVKTELSEEIKQGNVVIVSPDQGGVKRAEHFAEEFGDNFPCTSVYKKRENINGVSKAKAEKVNDPEKVKGKIAVLVDDMIDSGGSIIEAAARLKEAGATGAYVVAGHGIFSKDACKKFGENDFIKKVIVTNSLPLKADAPEKFEQVDISGLLKDTVKEIYNDYNPTTPIKD